MQLTDVGSGPRLNLYASAPYPLSLPAGKRQVETNAGGYHRVNSYTKSVSHRDNAVHEAAGLRLPRI